MALWGAQWAHMAVWAIDAILTGDILPEGKLRLCRFITVYLLCGNLPRVYKKCQWMVGGVCCAAISWACTKSVWWSCVHRPASITALYVSLGSATVLPCNSCFLAINLRVLGLPFSLLWHWHHLDYCVDYSCFGLSHLCVAFDNCWITRSVSV